MRKYNRKKGAVAFLLCFCMLLSFAGCGRNKKEQKTVWNDGSMLRIGESQVDYREGMVYLQAVQEEYEQYYGSDIWMYAIDGQGNTLGELVKEQILEQIIYIKIVCRQADTLGIVLTEEELHEVEEKTKAYMEKIKNSDLILYGVNEDIVRRIYSDNLLARKTFEYVTLNVDTDISDEEAGQHRLYSIAIRNYKIDASGLRVFYSEQETEELRARMQELHAQAEQTDDFYRLANSITEDSSMLELVAGPGDLPETYEKTVLGLKTGELSDVIETTDYYYIFYCVTDYDVDATHAKKEQIIAKRQEEEFKKRYEEWKQQTDIEVNEEVWDSIGFHTDAVG
ncbi:MAG: SurA N-terminal domain-containing protein [Lachnospiraceae bacterium]